MGSKALRGLQCLLTGRSRRGRRRLVGDRHMLRMYGTAFPLGKANLSSLHFVAGVAESHRNEGPPQASTVFLLKKRGGRGWGADHPQSQSPARTVRNTATQTRTWLHGEPQPKTTEQRPEEAASPQTEQRTPSGDQSPRRPPGPTAGCGELQLSSAGLPAWGSANDSAIIPS